jgi:uncharacterized protein with GYD domain
MPKYLIQANYIGDGIAGLLEEGGSERRKTVTALIESVGGTVESFYYAFGDTDVFVTAEVPDNVTAASLALTVNASGNVDSRITVLLTPEEIDAATRKSPKYRAPGS